MLALGFVLLIVCWALPQIFPDAPAPLPALEHIGWVLGWVFVVIGLFLFLFGHFTGRPVFGRQHWY
jgi:hypothetical protein